MVFLYLGWVRTSCTLLLIYVLFGWLNKKNNTMGSCMTRSEVMTIYHLTSVCIWICGFTLINYSIQTLVIIENNLKFSCKAKQISTLTSQFTPPFISSLRSVLLYNLQIVWTLIYIKPNWRCHNRDIFFNNQIYLLI